jgi:hypothetical protein
MSDAARIGFIFVTILAFGFFVFKKRSFDLLTIAYIGVLFYFSPLFWGEVLQSSHDIDPAIPFPVYLIATAFVLALVVAAVISARYSGDQIPPTPAVRPLSGWYLILALIGLVGAIVWSRGAIFNADKVQNLKEIGYLYVFFEIAASLACISAAMEGRWRIVAGGAFLLAVDLLVGFRAFVVLTALGVALVMLMRDGRIRLFTKAATYGSAAVLLIGAMLLVHTARFVIFDQVNILKNAPRTVRTQEMRGDILQTEKTQIPVPAPSGSAASPISAAVDDAATQVSKWLQIPFQLLQRSEPAIIQATLAGIVQRDVSCRPVNILKSLFLLVPPGLTALAPNIFPPTFYDEYQPILYPNITYGTGGNIWAEMLCRFGYIGVAIFGVLLILALIGTYQLLRKASPVAAAPIAFGGVVIAFYINRNDLHYTLVMLRQIALVFIGTYALSAIAAKARGASPRI